MKLIETLRFAARLVVAKKVRSALVALSIAISIAILTLFSAFGRGVEKLVLAPISAEIDARTLIVFRKTTSNFFSFAQTGLDDKTLKEFQKMPGVESVSPQLPLPFPSSIVIPLGLDFQVDMFFSGVEPKGLESVPVPEGTIPIFLNPQILDLYNSSFAEMIPGVSAIDPHTILGRKIAIEFGKSSFLPDASGFLGTKKTISKTGIIAGLSSRVPVFGFSIPLRTAEEISAEVLEKKAPPVFSRILIVGTDELATENIRAELVSHGFLVKSLAESGGKIRSTAIGFRATLSGLGVAIFTIALFSLLAILSVSLAENKKSIGILRSFGAARRDIFRIFFGEIFLLAGTGIALGLVIALSLGTIINILFQQSAAMFSFGEGVLFDFSGIFVGEIFFGTLLTAFVFGFFPIRRAARQEVLSALWE